MKFLLRGSGLCRRLSRPQAPTLSFSSLSSAFLCCFLLPLGLHPREALPCCLHPTGALVHPVETAKQRALHSIFFPGLRSLTNSLGLTYCHFTMWNQGQQVKTVELTRCVTLSLWRSHRCLGSFHPSDWKCISKLNRGALSKSDLSTGLQVPIWRAPRSSPQLLLNRGSLLWQITTVWINRKEVLIPWEREKKNLIQTKREWKLLLFSSFTIPAFLFCWKWSWV